MAKAAKKEDAATGAEAPEGAPKSKKKLLIVVVVALVLLGSAGGAAAWYFTHKNAAEAEAEADKGEKGEKGGKKSSHKKKAKAENAAPVFMNLEPFTVNLTPDDAGDQYLQVAITLKVDSNEVTDSLNNHLPEVRSRILLLLSGKKASEINNTAGKQKLAGELLDQVKLPFTPKGDEQEVEDVLFTQFVIQ